MRRFGEDESFASLFALRADDHQLDCFFDRGAEPHSRGVSIVGGAS